jgi:hypothetical protein
MPFSGAINLPIGKLKMLKTLTLLIMVLWLFGAAAQAGPPPVRLEGGPGDSPANAIIIKGATDGVAASHAEYQYLIRKFGKQDVDWRLLKDDLLQTDNQTLEVLTIILKDRTQKTIYFDITGFFGKR